MRHIVLPTALIALMTSAAVALASFPATSPSKVNEISVTGSPQKVAVDLTDDTAYIVSSGPGTITAANPTLTVTNSAAAGVQPRSVAVDPNDDTI